MRTRILSPWIPFASAMVTIAIAVWIAHENHVPQWIQAYQSNPREFVGLLVAFAGWLLALSGLLFAGRDAKRGLAVDALLKLHEDEGSQDQAVAKRLVWKTAPPDASSVNPYAHVREYIENLSPDEQGELDEARRRLTHFWYRAARLVGLGILDTNKVFKSVGPPDILTILEPLEAIQAESIDPTWQPRSWPPMTLLIDWYKKQGYRSKASQLKAEVPARPAAYKASRTSE